jgi:hypothetical protein
MAANCRKSCVPEVTMKTKKSISDDVRRAIALRAYHIWEREGRPHDRQQAHWQMAEAEILSEERSELVPPHPVETVMAVKKPLKAKTAAAPPLVAKPAKAPEVTAPPATAPKLKAAAAKASEGAKKTAKVTIKTGTAATKTKKAVKTKPVPRQS